MEVIYAQNIMGDVADPVARRTPCQIRNQFKVQQEQDMESKFGHEQGPRFGKGLHGRQNEKTNKSRD